MPRKQISVIAESTEIQTQSDEMNDIPVVDISEGGISPGPILKTQILKEFMMKTASMLMEAKQFLRPILKAAIIRRRMPSRVPKALKIQMFSKLTRKSTLILKMLTRVICYPMKKPKNPRPRRPAKLKTPKAEQLYLSLINRIRTAWKIRTTLQGLLKKQARQ